jgi:hypothetical protein
MPRKRNETRIADSDWPPSTERLEELIGEAITDAYGEEEQRIGFLTMLQDNLTLPFETEVLGVRVTVEIIELDPADEIVAFCRGGKHRQAIPVLYLPLPSPPPVGAEWIEAYRHWAHQGCEPP